MFKKQNLLGLIVLVLILVSLIIIFEVPRQVKNERHCYSMLSPVEKNSNGSSKIIESGCFNTFSESIKAATGGRVLLDPSINQKDVTDEMLNH